MVEDIFSRMIVAWEIHEAESADYAAGDDQQGLPQAWH